MLEDHSINWVKSLFFKKKFFSLIIFCFRAASWCFSTNWSFSTSDFNFHNNELPHPVSSKTTIRSVDQNFWSRTTVFGWVLFLHRLWLCVARGENDRRSDVFFEWQFFFWQEVFFWQTGMTVFCPKLMSDWCFS